MIKQYLIAAVAFALAGWAVSRKVKPSSLTCGPGYQFTKMTLAEAEQRWGSYSAWPKIRDQVRAYGGTCTKSGVVTDVGTKPVHTGPITQPSQLPD